MNKCMSNGTSFSVSMLLFYSYLYLCVCVRLSVHGFVCMSVCACVRWCLCFLCACLSVRIPICMAIFTDARVWLFVCVHDCPCVSMCMSMYGYLRDTVAQWFELLPCNVYIHTLCIFEPSPPHTSVHTGT